jgi:hypothetical protein
MLSANTAQIMGQTEFGILDLIDSPALQLPADFQGLAGT